MSLASSEDPNSRNIRTISGKTERSNSLNLRWGQHVGVEPLQSRFGCLGEAIEEATDAVMRRLFLQRAESLHQGIAPQEVQVTKAPAQLAVPSDLAQIPYHRFQSTVGSQTIGGEIDLQIAVDARVQILLLSSYWQEPFFFG